MTWSQEDVVGEWLSENRAEYDKVHQEVPVEPSPEGTPRKVDLFCVVSDSEPQVVDLFEVKEYLGPRAIGQVLYYSKSLPEFRNVVVRNRGIVFSKERDKMSRQLAEEHNITLQRIWVASSRSTRSIPNTRPCCLSVMWKSGWWRGGVSCTWRWFGRRTISNDNCGFQNLCRSSIRRRVYWNCHRRYRANV